MSLIAEMEEFTRQPWVMAYHGENQSGALGSYADYTRYLWVGQDLKEGITGRR